MKLRAAHIRIHICGLFFWLKAICAILFATACMSAIALEIYRLRLLTLQILKEGATKIAIDPLLCTTDSNIFSKLEPQTTASKLFGFHLDWSKQVPTSIKKILRRNPAIINAFLDVDITRPEPLRWGDFEWHSQEIAKIGGIFQLTLEPTSLSGMPDSLLEQIAQKCFEINQRGVPMFLRYGHEMNGDWTTYGNKPVDYVSGFIRMSQMIKRYTNLTAMVWAPNVGINYPFHGQSPLPTAKSDPINFAALDTNNDGVFDWRDDPYLPYYPGDEYVDWVGISLYWYPDIKVGYNGEIPPTFFIDQLTGQGPSMLNYNPRIIAGGLRDFYTRFSSSRNKPLMIAETSAPYFSKERGPLTEVQIKQEWWRQLYGKDAFERLPMLKAVIHFEEQKADADQEIRDWRILANPDVSKAFISDIDALGKKLLLATQLKYSCDGAITII